MGPQVPFDAPPPAPTVGIISYNLWLMPFVGPYNLGRLDRCEARLRREAARLEDAGCDLVVVCLQEAWCFRAGFLKPLFAIYARLEAFLLAFSGAAEEPAWARVPKALLHVLALATAWLPGLRATIYDPKKKLGILPWAGFAGSAAFAEAPLTAWPPLALDAGLHLVASSPPDAHGFEAFDRSGPINEEHLALKGLLWARWGRVAVVNTHLVARDAAGARRSEQRDALAAKAAALLHEDDVDAVFLVGDLNHALPSQTTPDMSVAALEAALARAGLACARLSSDAPTNANGTVDHVYVATRHDGETTWRARSSVVPDGTAAVSDHLLLTCRASPAS